MRTYGCQENARNGGVCEGSTSGEGVCGATCGRADDAAIGLDYGEEMSIAVELKVGDIGGRATIDDQFVKDFKLGILN